MRAKLLDRPTLSGDYEECRFNAYGSCTWVLFQLDDAEDWVGVFGRGELGRDGLAMSETGQTICVLARGLAYVVNTSERRLLHTSVQDQLQVVVSVPRQELFIAADFTRLHVYSPSGLEWSSERISFDGIRLGIADASGLDGKVWTMEEWVPFRLGYEKWRYTCGWRFPH